MVTIYAPATAPGRAAVAVVRVSGPEAFAVLARIAGDRPAARRLVRRRLRDPRTGAAIDDALVVAFAGPASFTGEDVVEFHVHGGSLATRRLLAALGGLDGLEPAAPGAFTRRAFLNGRLDLTQAEAIADLIDAETEAQARQALRQLDGGFGRRVRAWQDRLLSLRAPLEAALDFADEGDVDGDAADPSATLAVLRGEMAAVLADDRGERLRNGPRVVLVGVPNAGKSSLINALAKRDVAIVTPVPGTTRDLLEVSLELDGRPLTLVDAAGLRGTTDPVEVAGVRRATAAAEAADLRLVLLDGALWPSPRAGPALRPREDDLLVLSKADLVPPEVATDARDRRLIRCSVRTADGLEALVAALSAAVGAQVGQGVDVGWTRARHRQALTAATAAIARATALADPVLRAEELRLAGRHLGSITGETGVEGLLDRIFASFCIGK